MTDARPPLVATDRAALILQLVPYLIEHGEVSVAEAAADFDVSETQMRQIVEKLTVIGRPGDGGYWQLPHDLFDIDWDLLDEQGRIAITHTVGLERAPKLTAREAAALLAGLQVVAAVPGVGEGDLMRGLLAKLARGAATAPAELVLTPAPVDAVRRSIDDALTRGVAASFTYKTPEGAPTVRTVDPVKVHITGGEWYLQGWCHLRRAMRTFNLDRVSDVALTDIPITHSGEPVPPLFEPGGDDATATIRFAERLTPLLGEYLSYADVACVDGVCTATMRIGDPRSLRRLVTRRGGDVEILAPESARRAARDWAAAALAQYDPA